MLRLYTDKSKINNGKETEIIISKIFNARIGYKDICDSNEIKAVMQEIDGAELIGTDGAVKTNFGICSIKQLSTSAKTVILMLVYKDRFNYDVTSCGANVLPKVFEVAERYNISLVLRHTDIPERQSLIVPIDDLMLDDKIIDYDMLDVEIMKELG